MLSDLRKQILTLSSQSQFGTAPGKSSGSSGGNTDHMSHSAAPVSWTWNDSTVRRTLQREKRVPAAQLERLGGYFELRSEISTSSDPFAAVKQRLQSTLSTRAKLAHVHAPRTVWGQGGHVSRGIRVSKAIESLDRLFAALRRLRITDHVIFDLVFESCILDCFS